MRIATWCPYCGFFQYTEFMNHAYCKQCGKTFSPEKAKGVELRSATSIENLEKEMLDEISRLSVKEHLIYCLFVVCTKFGCDVQYKPKRLFCQHFCSYFLSNYAFKSIDKNFHAWYPFTGGVRNGKCVQRNRYAAGGQVPEHAEVGGTCRNLFYDDGFGYEA